MKTQDLRELDKTSLLNQANDLKIELAEYKEAVLSGKEKNHAKLAYLKRDLARANTILSQKE